MWIKNFFGHLKTVLKHKCIVFKLSIKAGIPMRGLLHDMSKFSPVEFFESVKFYQGGKRSPISASKKANGYSKAWLHHKGRNKHHLEYWFDESLEAQPIIPFKYILETICDKLSASIVYEGKNWTNSSEIQYWNEKEKDKAIINPKIRDFLTEVFEQVSQKGINPVIKKANLRKIYNKIVLDK